MDELRIVLLGKQGAGKSASGNTLLHNQSFRTAASSEPVTQACSVKMCTVDKQTIKVVDTPGWCDSSQFKTDIKQEILNMSSPGPHAFLLALPIGRFTNEEINTVMNILKEFGDEVTKYMIVLFTKGDDLEDRPIKDYLKELHSDLKTIIQLCGDRYHVFNNRDKTNYNQVYSLLKKVNKMVESNEVKFYTTAMYQKVKAQQKDDTTRQQCKREKDHSVQDISRNQSGSQNGDRRNRCEEDDRERDGISEVRMEHFKENIKQQQPWEDDRYSYDIDDARRRNVEGYGKISKEGNRQECVINKLHKSKEMKALEHEWAKERDHLKNQRDALDMELKKKKSELKEIQHKLETQMLLNKQLQKQVDQQQEMLEEIKKMAQQKTTDEKTKTRAFLDFVQNLFKT